MKFLLLLFFLLPTMAHPAENYSVDELLGTLTAYSASEDETDSTPRITASGKEVKEGYVANNCLPFGTIVEINGVKFEVQDRKNKRYNCHWFDLFIDSKAEAKQFGIWYNQKVKIYGK